MVYQKGLRQKYRWKKRTKVGRILGLPWFLGNEMEIDATQIYLDRLKDGKEYTHEGEILPGNCGIVDEKGEYTFSFPLLFKTRAYITDDVLILEISLETKATLFCKICTEPVEMALFVEKSCKTVPVSACRDRKYDYQADIREEVLLAIPHFIECSGGECPSRPTFKTFLR